MNHLTQCPAHNYSVPLLLSQGRLGAFSEHVELEWLAQCLPHCGVSITWTPQVEAHLSLQGSPHSLLSEMRAWPASGSIGLPAACSPVCLPGLSSAWPAAPWEAQGWGMGKPPPPAWGLPEPLPTLRKGLSHPAPAVQPRPPPPPPLQSQDRKWGNARAN